MAMAKLITFVTAHKRVITFATVVLCAVVLTLFLAYPPPPAWGWVGLLFFFVIVATVIASQLFWVARVLDLAQRFIPGKPRRIWLAVIATVVYVLFLFNASPTTEIFKGHIIRPVDPRLHRVVMDGLWSVWLVGSWAGFVLVVIFWTVDQAARGATWAYVYIRQTAAGDTRAGDPSAISLPSFARRHFLRQTAIAISATPFAAAAYGLLYGRLDVEVTHQRIRLARLPKVFEGFRFVQLSDIHISPFMPADQIRRCVTITNGLKPDLIALTGDFVSWDPAAQDEVVRVLAGLHAPHGVFGCLGNHESITDTEQSITRLFAAQDIRILRQERASIQSNGEMFNLIGIDDSQPDLGVIKALVMPNVVNILLVHFIGGDFERAVNFGIDLTLAGHIHGGQLSLESVRRGLSLGRLETPYVSGWFEKSGGQLYVNRGIGTTMLPIRLGARPEITVLELVSGTTSEERPDRAR